MTLDSVKSRAKGTTWKIPGAAGGRDDQAAVSADDLSPEAQEEIEKAEDEFVTQTEEAVGVMKNVSGRKGCPLTPVGETCEPPFRLHLL